MLTMVATTRWVTNRRCVADHAHRLAIAGKQGVRGVADVHARGRVGGQHAPLGGGFFHQHVDANGAGWVQLFDHRHGGHIKPQGRPR